MQVQILLGRPKICRMNHCCIAVPAPINASVCRWSSKPEKAKGLHVGSTPIRRSNQQGDDMSKQDKKKAKLVERLSVLEADLRLALQKKSSSSAEIDVPGKMRQIQELKAQINSL